jgi:HlyD family secretion protein
VLFEEKPDVLMLARGPFIDAHGGRFAYVMDGDIAVRRPISIGATSVSAVEVVEGLQPGDRVVIAGTDNFEDAERVAINR